MADATNQLRVKLVTPERVLFEHTVEAVELPAKNGYFEVLYGHAPLVAELGAGDVTLIGAPDGTHRYNVSWGFVEVLPERVTILASDALSRARSTCLALKSNSHAVTSSGMPPAKTRKNTTTHSTSFRKPKPKSHQPTKRTNLLLFENHYCYQRPYSIE